MKRMGENMTTAELTKKMVDFYHESLHDINHFLKVYTYTETLGECVSGLYLKNGAHVDPVF